MHATKQLEQTLDRIGSTFTVEEITGFLDKQKKRGVRTVEALKGVIDNIDVNFNTHLGREIMTDDIMRFESLLSKVIIEEATPGDIAELRVIKGRLKTMSKRLDIFMDSLKKVGGNNGR